MISLNPTTNPESQELQSFTFTVKLKGGTEKEVTAFRRGPGMPWTIKPRFGGRQRWASLKVAGQSKDDLALAKKRAQVKIQQWVDEEFAPPAPKAVLAKSVATIGQVATCYLDKATAVSFRDRVDKFTAERNVGELRRVVRIGLDRPTATREEIDALPLSVLTRGLVDSFLQHYLAGVETATHDERNELAVDRRSNGAAHALRQAKSIFAKDKLPVFAGLVLPDLAEFRQAASLPVQHREHKAIAPETVAAMHTAAEKLKAENPRLWLIHTVLKHLGLRPSEAEEAELGWLMRTAWGQWFLAIVVTEKRRPKASLGYTPIAAEVALELMTVRQELAAAAGEVLTDESPLIPGTPYQRYHAIYREHSAFMRAFVPAATHEKSSYELRRWAAQTIRRKYGKDASSDFARHSAKDVTQQHYLERLNVWRDRAPLGNAGITWDDARGHVGEQMASAATPSDWRGLVLQA